MNTAITGGPAGTGSDPANPAAGPARRDQLQAAVFGTEFARPERWGPAAPPYPDAPEKSADEAGENYYGGDRQPQMREVDLGAGGLRADTVAEPNRTWEGQNGSPVGGGPAPGAGGGRGGYKSGTDQTVNLREGGRGMIPLPPHMRSTDSGRRRG